MRQIFLALMIACASITSIQYVDARPSMSTSVRSGSGFSVSRSSSSSSGFGRAYSSSSSSSSLGTYMRRNQPTAARPSVSASAPSSAVHNNSGSFWGNNTPSPRYTPPPVVQHNTTTVIHHNDGGNGFVNGMLIGTILGNHDHGSSNVTNNTYNNGVPVNNGTTTNTPQNSGGFSSDAPPATTPNSATNAPMPNKNDNGVFAIGFIILLLMLAGLGYLGYRLYTLKNRARDTINNLTNPTPNNNTHGSPTVAPYATLPSNIVNPLNVKVPGTNSTSNGSPISIDRIALTNIVTGDSHFPRLHDTDYNVMGYSKLVTPQLSGIGIERILLGDGAVFIQNIIDDHQRIIETAIYQRIDIDSNPDIDKILQGATPVLGSQTFNINDKRKNNTVTYQRSMQSPDAILQMRGRETFYTNEGVENMGNIFMAYERQRSDQGIESILLQVTYDGDDNDPRNPQYEVYIGAPLNKTDITVYN